MIVNQTRGYAGDRDRTRVIHNDEETRFTALADSGDAAYWVDFRLDVPIGDTYIMIPGCAYDGNRFETVMRRYPPMYTEEEFGVGAPVRMTCVPALSPEGDSFMDVTTGDRLYLELMSRIAHFIPQTVSYPEQPMYTVQGPALRPSEICERVNLSDWEGAGNVGDAIAGNSVWPTAALMLTWLETPGVYADSETGLVCASDHVNAWLEDGKLIFPALKAITTKTHAYNTSEIIING